MVRAQQPASRAWVPPGEQVVVGVDDVALAVLVLHELGGGEPLLGLRAGGLAAFDDVLLGLVVELLDGDGGAQVVAVEEDLGERPVVGQVSDLDVAAPRSSPPRPTSATGSASSPGPAHRRPSPSPRSPATASCTPAAWTSRTPAREPRALATGAATSSST